MIRISPLRYVRNGCFPSSSPIKKAPHSFVESECTWQREVETLALRKKISYPQNASENSFSSYFQTIGSWFQNISTPQSGNRFEQAEVYMAGHSKGYWKGVKDTALSGGCFLGFYSFVQSLRAKQN